MSTIPPASPLRSLVIPVYMNERNIQSLLAALDTLHQSVGPQFEVVFVVDGSPDGSYCLIRDALPTCPYAVRLVALSRNFGAFSAIRTGIEYAAGEHIAVMAADLQEPITLIQSFFELLGRDECDIVFGQRQARHDPFVRRTMSNLYWAAYRKTVLRDIPQGGVDVFACNQRVRSALLRITEPNSSLIAQLFWVGFRRAFVPYERAERKEGSSAWNLSKRIKYMLDSVFSYTDIPIMLMMWIGAIGLVVTLIVGIITLCAKLGGWIVVPGYAATILLMMFMGSMIMMSQGIIGCYLWRCFENSKHRPLTIVNEVLEHKPEVGECHP